MEPPPIKPYGVPCLNLPPVFRNLRGTFFICRFRADCRLCLVGRWRSCTSPACPTCTQHSVHPNRALHSVRPRFQSPQLLAVDTIPIHMPRTHQLRRTADPLRPMARVTAPTRRTRIPHRIQVASTSKHDRLPNITSTNRWPAMGLASGLCEISLCGNSKPRPSGRWE